MFLDCNILEPFIPVCMVIIFSPIIARHVISSYKMADIQGILCSIGPLSFFHVFFMNFSGNWAQQFVGEDSNQSFKIVL